MPLNVRLSEERPSNRWLNEPNQPGHFIVASGKTLRAHRSHIGTTLVNGLTNGQKILQNLTNSDSMRSHPGWANNRKLLEERISTSLENIVEIIVEDVLIKSTDEGLIYFLKLIIRLNMETNIKLNKMGAIHACFILDRGLNLHALLPLVIDFRETLHLGIPGLIKSIPQGSELIDHNSLLFNLSNSNQPHNLSWNHNRKLLEECTSANIHDISLITIENISSKESGKQSIVVLDIELLRDHSISAFFLLTDDYNLESRYVNKTAAAPKHIVLSSSVAAVHNTDKTASPDLLPAPSIKPAAQSNCPSANDGAEDEDIDTLLMMNSDGLPELAELPELPDYDDVRSGKANTAEEEAKKYNIEWGTGKFMFFAPIPVPKTSPVAFLNRLHADTTLSTQSNPLNTWGN